MDEQREQAEITNLLAQAFGEVEAIDVSGKYRLALTIRRQAVEIAALKGHLEAVEQAAEVSEHTVVPMKAQEQATKRA